MLKVSIALAVTALLAAIVCVQRPSPLSQSVAWAGIAPASPASIKFNRDVRPILSDRCFSCHGPDSNKRQSGLRLDLKPSAFGPLPKHAGKIAFVPGKPEESYAYQRMISSDPTEVMPPATSHLKVNAHEREIIRQWILQGAPWQEHWAFVKPTRPEPPSVDEKAWPRNDIDRFILARLESEGMRPAAEADRPTLIRRVSLDLTGLPPSAAEVEAFVADTSPDAYEKIVDRLLNSPRYGEQMATQWLDYARYADSHGFQADPERHMWHWRDWVIDAFNRNMPFDQFATWQLAGDLLPHATEEQKLATGFNRNHRINGEGGVIDEEWRVETVIDRVETTSATFMGLTMGCCRCHDHKFDPITQKEFYSFSAYFNSINERGEYSSQGIDAGVNVKPLMKYFTPDQSKRMEDLKTQIAAADAKLEGFHSRLPEREEKLRSTLRSRGAPSDPFGEAPGLLVKFALNGSADGEDGAGKKLPAMLEGPAESAWITVDSGKALACNGKNSVDAGQAVHFERNQSFSYGARVKLSGDGSILGKMDADPSFRGFDIYLQNGSVAPHWVHDWAMQDALKVTTKAPAPRDKWVYILVTYDGSSKAAGVKVYFDGKLQGTTTEFDHLTGTILSKAPLLIGRRVNSNALAGAVQDARFYSRVLTAGEASLLANRADVQLALLIPAAQRTAEQRNKVAETLLATDPEFAKAMAERDQIKRDLDGVDNDPRNTTMVMEELPKPRDTFILLRGQYDKHGEKVEPGVPGILPPLPAGAPPNRLGLAMWIVDPGNPLTARVQANRLWEKFFGVGIVKTTENFGTQSEWPSHPELLDWLACELVARKWDLKAFQKLIVTSAAYRQSAGVTPDLLERDPENRLVARGPRFRLSAEEVRDQALAVSGLLVEKIGGPSVKPYEPLNLWENNLYGNLGKYVVASGQDLYRRSLYTFLKRTAAPPNLTIFDMPTREYCIVKRSRTNTPLQALDVMNDSTYLEAARVLAEHMIRDGGVAAADRLAFGFRRATARPPTDVESRILQQALADQLQRYRKDPQAAVRYLTVGAWPRDAKLDPAELAAYSVTASIILNLDEMMTKP